MINPHFIVDKLNSVSIEFMMTTAEISQLTQIVIVWHSTWGGKVGLGCGRASHYPNLGLPVNYSAGRAGGLTNWVRRLFFENKPLVFNCFIN